MALPSSGILAFSTIASELQRGTSNVALNDTDLRGLAEKANGQISVSDFYNKQHLNVVAYYGLSTVKLLDASGILALTPLSNPVLPYNLTLTAGVDQFMYWASPVSFGEVQFFDRESQFAGGWDGAHGYPQVVVEGPKTILVNGQSYYLYRTDYDNLGRVPWQVQVKI